MWADNMNYASIGIIVNAKQAFWEYPTICLHSLCIGIILL